MSGFGLGPYDPLARSAIIWVRTCNAELTSEPEMYEIVGQVPVYPEKNVTCVESVVVFFAKLKLL